MALSCRVFSEASPDAPLSGAGQEGQQAVVGPSVFSFISMNLRKTMYKLQTALNIGGRPVRINQFQTWIADQKRMVTRFVVIENGETILETYKTADVVQALADMLGGD